MNMNRKLLSPVLLFSALGLYGATLPRCALAQDADAPAEAQVLPAVLESEGIRYVSGGIGSGEAAAMRAESRHYALTLMFYVQAAKAMFVADVDVLIQDAAGKVLMRTRSEGPFLLVQLPAGHYQINCAYRGQEKHFTLAQKGAAPQLVNVMFKDEPAP
ncbi:hypothetical protein SAMN04488038_12114 [Solimonas aquatica]|uniref:Carboxypeptidase regulatory-like domain-containing protein n=2 Tax=Solimonas aquatica TaxID=489703 RepID=A0A1H9MD00_9GAMM|nr:hypothetical protein SAMN04488038_12114 [Solimonas aquatica]